MTCNRCSGYGWQQTRENTVPAGLVAQKQTSDLLNTSSILANTAKFVTEVESAGYSPYKQVTIVPYFNNLVSAVVPQAPGDALLGALGPNNQQLIGPGGQHLLGPGGQRRLGPGGLGPQYVQAFNGDSCGCCPTPYLPMTQHAALVLEDVVLRNQQPIEDILGPSCRRVLY